jgi:hypothetical protein
MVVPRAGGPAVAEQGGMRKSLGGVLLSMVLVACSGSPATSDPPGGGGPPANPGNGGSDPGDDDPADPGDDDPTDPGGGGDDPVDPGVCLAEASVGAFTEPEAYLGAQEEMPTLQVRSFYAQVGTGDPPDFIEITLVDGAGAFAAGTAQPGSYDLATEAMAEECGVCVALLIDLDVTSDADVEPAQSLYAVSGSVTVTSVDGNLTGSLENVVFQRYDETAEDFDAACQSTLATGTFDAPLMTDTGM